MSPGIDRDGPIDPLPDIQAAPGSAGDNTGPRRHRRGGGGRGRFGGRGSRERSMVPEAEFTSYYGRPIVKESPWEADIPAYLFAGGLAGGSSLVAAAADLTGRPALRRAARLGALGALSFSGAALVHDLGRPERFLHMLRVVKPTSPMSMGTWILTAYAPGAGLAALAELARFVPARRRRGVLRLLGLLPVLERPAGLAAAALAPALASYTAVLLADTATPSWHNGYRELPFVFVGSAAAASAGLGLLTAPTAETGPLRTLALGALTLELVAEHRMEQTMGVVAEPLHDGVAGRWMRAAKTLTVAGGVGVLVAGAVGPRARPVAALSGAALVAGSFCTRFGIFEAGQASARDPKYVVVPQRERIAREGSRATSTPARG